MAGNMTYEELKKRVQELEKHSVEFEKLQGEDISSLLEIKEMVDNAADALCIVDKNYNLIFTNKTF